MAAKRRHSSIPPKALATADAFFGIFGLKRRKSCIDCLHWEPAHTAEEGGFYWKICKEKNWDSRPCKYFKEP